MNPINESLLEEVRLTVGKVLTPDLLRPDWRAKAQGEHHTYGHCYIAAEALFHLLGGFESEFVPRFVKYFDKTDNMVCTHWWLFSPLRQRILDPTKEQYLFAGEDPPYHNKNTSGFLTKEPSKRAKVIMERVQDIVHQQQLDELKQTFKKEVNALSKIF